MLILSRYWEKNKQAFLNILKKSSDETIFSCFVALRYKGVFIGEIYKEFLKERIEKLSSVEKKYRYLQLMLQSKACQTSSSIFESNQDLKSMCSKMIILKNFFYSIMTNNGEFF